jgi:hypothetical protein
MDLHIYQRKAWEFDQQGPDHATGLTVSLLGLGGEVGDLLTSQKKRVRDRVTPSSAREADTEAIGDILWYLAVTAARLGVDLDNAGLANLSKAAGRWPLTDEPYPNRSAPPRHPGGIRRSDETLGSPRIFDEGHLPRHRLPRTFRIVIGPDPVLGSNRIRMAWNGRKFGDPLSDNTVEADWYRYHDAFHLAYAAVLGWSPVFRLLGGLKRKDVPLIDEVEDGGRAIAIEEGIAAFLFEEGRRNDWFEFGQSVPGEALDLCRRLTGQLEVRVVTPREWERAILLGFNCWRNLVDLQWGVLVGDLDSRTLSVEDPDDTDRTEHQRVCVSEAEKAEANRHRD